MIMTQRTRGYAFAADSDFSPSSQIIWAYYPFAWGLPLIIVAVTLGVRFCDYGSEY